MVREHLLLFCVEAAKLGRDADLQIDCAIFGGTKTNKNEKVSTLRTSGGRGASLPDLLCHLWGHTLSAATL